MGLTTKMRQTFLKILREELVPAMGCTEPIALAYAAAKAREILGKLPKHVVAECSGNIIKNVKCVFIPNSGNLRGISASVLMGLVAGNAQKKMEVLSDATEQDIEKVQELLSQPNYCEVRLLDSEIPLHIRIELFDAENHVLVEIKHSHTNIVRIEKNDEVLLEDNSVTTKESDADYGMLTIQRIKEYADTVSLEEVQPLIDREISYNIKIAQEGLSGKYGLGLGKIILEVYPDSVLTRMKAYAAAGSEARMSGCELPVIINSGSGNQGMASSIPVIIYAQEKGFNKEILTRALVFSNLLTIFQKSYIGRLSAFCGAVSAGCASGAAVTYMEHGTLEQISMTVDNTLANIPGIICDGAKASCASKIVTSLEAAMMAHYLALRGRVYEPESGILQNQSDETISCVGLIGRDGMRQIDKEILKIMVK